MSFENMRDFNKKTFGNSAMKKKRKKKGLLGDHIRLPMAVDALRQYRQRKFGSL